MCTQEEGQYILLLWNQAPRNHIADGLLGPNSIMVVYMHPLGTQNRSKPLDAKPQTPQDLHNELVGLSVEALNLNQDFAWQPGMFRCSLVSVVTMT